MPAVNDRTILSDEDLEKILECLTMEDPLPLGRPLLRTAEELKQQFPEQATDLRCPVCCSRMALRDGKFGLFYGCSTYPKCRGTRDANQVTAAPIMTIGRSSTTMPAPGVSPQLQKARREAEDYVEHLWGSGRMGKKEAEMYVAKKIGRPLCFDDFDVETCNLVVEVVKDRIRPRTRFELMDMMEEDLD